MALMALAALPGLGPVRIRQLDRNLSGRVESLLEMADGDRARWCSPRLRTELAGYTRFFDPGKVRRELARLNADYLTCEDPGYPSRLAPYSDRPIGLYRCRAGTAFPERCLAIVGTRRPSSYGRGVARQFASELSKAGFAIISGLAEGIDTEAHRATLQAGGLTAAVLGGGLNRLYPSSNRELMADISLSAGVWTEFPLWRKADRRTFPQRNRIVSGVSEGVLVIESGEQGGSLITARFASEQGKPVYVVPGRIDSAASAGCHALIRDGAQLVTSAAEILEDLAYLPTPLQQGGRAAAETRGTGDRDPMPQLDEGSARVWEFARDHAPVHPDAIAQGLSLPYSTASGLILDLELKGLLLRRLDGCYETGAA